MYYLYVFNNLSIIVFLFCNDFIADSTMHTITVDFPQMKIHPLLIMYNNSLLSKKV